jgi:hypothetical protein
VPANFNFLKLETGKKKSPIKGTVNGDYILSLDEEGESHRNNDASAGNSKNVKSARPLNIAIKIEINNEKKIKEKKFIFLFLYWKLSFIYLEIF